MILPINNHNHKSHYSHTKKKTKHHFLSQIYHSFLSKPPPEPPVSHASKLKLSSKDKKTKLFHMKLLKYSTRPIYHSSPTIQLQEIPDLNFSEEIELGGPGTASLTPFSLGDQYLSESHMQMEESSNGKLEETQKVELKEQDGKVVFVEDVGDSNPVGESGRDIDIADISEFPNKRDIKIEDFSGSVDKTLEVKDSSSSSSSSDEEKETAEESPQTVDSDQLEEKKEIPESIEPPVDSESNERNEDETAGEDSPFVSDFPSKEIDRKTLPNFEKSNGFPPVVTDLESNSSFENENKSKSIVETSVAAKGIEETGSASLDEKNVDHPVVTESSAREENGGESSAQVVYKASSDNGGVCDMPEISGSTVNPPIVPVTRRSLEPTSWRSCCGLFEVLRRSDR